MSRRFPCRKLALVASLALALGGCLEWVVPGNYAERGYDGAADPHALTSEAGLSKTLEERFQLIQTR